MSQPSSPRLPADSVEALQDALGAEHAAIWVHGLVSAFLPGDFAASVADGANAHRARRDATELLLSDSGQEPRSAEAAYVPPQPVTDQPSAIAVLVVAETDATVAWRAVLERCDGESLRTAALAGLTDAAVRATRWRRAAGQSPVTPALPGKPA